MREPNKGTRVTVPVDLVFLVDGSGSVNSGQADGFQKSQEYVKDVVSELQVGKAPTDTRVAVVQFSVLQTIEISLKNGTDKDEIHKAVDQMSYLRGGTCTGDGIFRVRTEVFTDAREDAQKVLVVLTDGNPSTGCDKELASQAKKAREEGTTVLAIGVGGGIDETNLEALAGGPQNVLEVNSFDELVTMVRPTSTVVCEETGGVISTPALTPAPTPVPTPWSEDASTHSHGQDGECADFTKTKKVLQIDGWFKTSKIDGFNWNFKTETEEECVDHMIADPHAYHLGYTWIPSWFDQHHPYNCFLQLVMYGVKAKPDFPVCSGTMCWNGECPENVKQQ
jgi:uncharacterized protein YegL